MALVFRSLPSQTLNTWLPDGVNREGPFGGLNIANPLDNGGGEREWVDLSESKDPLVQDYIQVPGEREETNQNTEKRLEQPVTVEKKHTFYEQPVIHISGGAMLVMVTAVFVGFMVYSRNAATVPRPSARLK